MQQVTSDGPEPYLARLVDPLLTAALEGLPAISLVGPRACGKATSARRLAADRVSLNKAEDAAAFLASPDAALARLAEPALLDEWQDVPTVLAAVKRAVDENPRPGRFILTGSVSIETETETWPATGRVTRLNMYPLTQREILGVSGALFVDRAVKADPAELPGAARRLDVFDYLAMATAGGFPDAVIRRSGLARELWLASYLVELLSKDAKRAGTGTAIDYTRLRPGRDDRARAALRAGTESGPSSGKTRMVRHIAGGGSYGGGWGICG